MGNGRGGGHFNKPPLSSAELVDLLVARGLVVDDRSLAREALFHIGYYRLAPYLRPFERQGGRHEIAPGTTFADVLSLYSFDRDLRLLAMDSLARIEIAFRAALSEVMSQVDSDSHWYTRPHYFADANDFRVLQGNVAQALEQPFPALQDYLRRYRTPELPPSWLMVEVLSIGQLNRVHKALKQPAHRRAVARGMGSTDTLLSSWLDVFVRLRNLAAHHERMWDVRLERYPQVPEGEAIEWPRHWDRLLEESGKTMYCVLSAVQSTLFTVSPTSPWAGELASLLAGRELERESMGFPADWTEDPFWARAIAAADPGSF